MLVMLAVLVVCGVLGALSLTRSDQKPNVGPATPAPSADSAGLPLAPPTLDDDHRTVEVNDAASTRTISLKDDEDCLIRLPDSPVSDYQSIGRGDALVTVKGGRNVVVVGGHIEAERPPVTQLTAPVADENEMTLTVASTAGYPSSGVLRLDGEGIVYSDRDATHFYVESRQEGYFNDSEVSSDSAHAVGAQVYLGESYRSGLSFMGQTGTIHVEGLLIDGFLNDGIRVSGGQAVLQVERTRIGPNTNYDIEHETDGHPDGIQAYGSGASEIRLAQVTLLTGPNGNGLLNKGTDSEGGTPVDRWRLRDVEVVSPEGLGRSLIANSDSSTEWDVMDSRVRFPRGQPVKISDSSLAEKFEVLPYSPKQRDIVPAADVGTGYRSQGYADTE